MGREKRKGGKNKVSGRNAEVSEFGTERTSKTKEEQTSSPVVKKPVQMPTSCISLTFSFGFWLQFSTDEYPVGQSVIAHTNGHLPPTQFLALGFQNIYIYFFYWKVRLTKKMRDRKRSSSTC